MQSRTGANTLLSDFGGQAGMQYDGVGNRTSTAASVPGLPVPNWTASYQYDGLDRLLQEQSGAGGGINNQFQYDAASNPTLFRGQAQTFNNNNQNTALSYSDEGNPTTHNGNALTYDALDRLTSYGSVMTAGYNGSGMRAWKQTASGRTYFLYDGADPICEMDSTGNVTAVNSYGANGLLSRTTTAGTTWYTFDPQGSVLQRLNDSGSVVSTSAFDSYGNRVTSGDSTDPFGYCAQHGYYTDVETGLILCSLRYYDPAQGRFLTRDPSGYAGGLNLYGYCRGNPVGMVDPSGLDPMDPSTRVQFEAEREEAELCRIAGLPPGVPYSPGLALISVTAHALGDASVLFISDGAGQLGGQLLGRGLARIGIPEMDGLLVGGVGGTNCFVAGTLVQMADGTTRAIEQLKVGDLVWSRNEKSGRTKTRRIIATTHHKSGEVIHLVLADPHTGKVVQEFTVSVEHPFYVDGKGFVGASHLGIGSQIFTRAGPKLVVKSMVVRGRAQGWELYNFTVEKDHTYFVGNTRGGVWVHNTISLRPFADSSELNSRLIEQMYRGSWQNGQWVSRDLYPGGLAGAIRRQLATGQMVGNVDHIQKAENRLDQMKRILETGEVGRDTLGARDIKIVRSLHNDLQSALQGK